MSSKRSRGAALLQAAGGVLPSAPAPAQAASPHKRLAVEGAPAPPGGGGGGGGAQCSPRSTPASGAAVDQRERGHGRQAEEEEEDAATSSQPRALPLDLHRLLQVFGGCGRWWWWLGVRASVKNGGAAAGVSNFENFAAALTDPTSFQAAVCMMGC